MEIVAVDIGGTHARFALAEVEAGRVVHLAPEVTLKTAENASFQLAWEAFAEHLGRPLPRAAGIAIAGPVQGEVLKLTNNPWVIRPALIPEKLHVDAYTLVNDFGAVGHSVAQADAAHLRHLCGPDTPFPDEGVITVVGPGTGLGVAHVLRRAGRYHVTETEGGHVDYAPLDRTEDAILAHLRTLHRRVSTERIVSGPGLVAIYTALATLEGRPFTPPRDDKALWTVALDGSDSLAAAAFDRFCQALGSVAGDLALAQGATGVVVAGGLGQRIADRLPGSGFAQRFTAKGRFEAMMSRIPVKLITHPQPGLYGAAAAFAQEHAR
ncbi:glucokinase [Sphingomonas quercus]|uniref:Glucokinase n=1 Tax=Sphingomonas quercus TaxID=2842451 RepID=A0ABS6BJ52_9SPHN|nr:glucokinase [Sphingomonas quercus]MBU3078331.1 glucokinase [Sphingomonas quercus]